MTTENSRIEEIEKRASILVDDLAFPPLNDKLNEGSRSTLLWALAYVNYRIINGASPEQSKEYLDCIGQNSSVLASKFRGTILGLAIGDAFGSTLEFSIRDSLPKVDDLVGGGPFNLNPGEWTDDTSMALCMAHSLIRKEFFCPTDHLDLYSLWWKKGYFSVNGRCFDIGNTVIDALNRYQKTGESYPGSTDPNSAGNGSLMRLAPIALFYFSDPERCVRYCGSSSKTTHGAKEAIDACRYFGALLHGAINGEDKEQLTQKLYEPLPGIWEKEPLAQSIVNVATTAHKKSRDEISSSGYVVDTLEAAIWAFHHASNFEDGVILAANLAGDSDTVAAIYGQLAGAYYGEAQMKPEWIKKLSSFHVFYYYADQLLRFGISDYPRLIQRKMSFNK